MRFDRPILGYRTWTPDTKNRLLLPPVKKTKVWTQGINRASCPECLDACPGPKCLCGFNAFYHPILTERHKGLMGAIAGAGDVCMHSLGFRASEAQIIALMMTREDAQEFVRNRIDPERIKEIASRYGVPIFSTQVDLISYSRQIASDIAQVKPGLSGEDSRNIWRTSASEDEGEHLIIGGMDTAWMKDGVLHREEGLPAVGNAWGRREEYWFQGQLHRENDLPAVERMGHKEWWFQGHRHRDGGPAVIIPDGTREWWCHGRLHRLDGPAVVWGEKGPREYWREGQRYMPKKPSFDQLLDR